MSVPRCYGWFPRLYDTLARLPIVRRWRREALDALGLEPGDTVVEMGCGTGANFPALQRHVGSDGRIVGVDLTEPLLRRARARVTQAGWSNVNLVHGDAEQPPVMHADAVLATFVIGLMDDPAQAVTSWCELVDSGGPVVLLEATRSDRLGVANVAFDLFVRVGAPGRPPGASRMLGERVAAATAALNRRTSRHRQARFGLGTVEVHGGIVTDPATDGGRDQPEG